MTTTVQQWGLSKSNSNRQEQITEVILTHFMIIYIMMIKANEKIQYFLLEQIKFFIYYWILKFCVQTKLGYLSMGDDIETGRSTGSDYWAAQRWLSWNQTKQPAINDRLEPMSSPINNPAKSKLECLCIITTHCVIFLKPNFIY